MSKRQLRNVLKVCDHSGPREIRRQTFSTGSVHLRSTCGKCRRFLMWAPQTRENLQEALGEHRPPTIWAREEVVLHRQSHAGPETVESIDFPMGDHTEPRVEIFEW